MIKAIIFDMDGILIDSSQLHFLAYQKALKEEGIEITKQDYIEEGAGKSNEHLFGEMARKYCKPVDVEKVTNRKREIFRQLIDSKLHLREGISKVLQKLHGKYALAVASSTGKVLVNEILKKFQIDSFFDVVLGGDEIFNKKPAPDIYLAAAHNLGLDPERCVAIEDSAPGMNSAKRAGVKCIVVPTEFTVSHDFSSADLVIDTLGELKDDKIKQLQNNTRA